MGHHLIQDIKSGDVFCAWINDSDAITAISDALHWSDWSDKDGTMLPDFDVSDCESLNIDEEFMSFEFRVLA